MRKVHYGETTGGELASLAARVSVEKSAFFRVTSNSGGQTGFWWCMLTWWRDAMSRHCTCPPLNPLQVSLFSRSKRCAVLATREQISLLVWGGRELQCGLSVHPVRVATLQTKAEATAAIHVALGTETLGDTTKTVSYTITGGENKTCRLRNWRWEKIASSHVPGWWPEW